MGAQDVGCTKREGIFDENNGIFLEDDGTNYKFVRRTSASGSPVDNAVNQSAWNIDKMDGTGSSGITLDFTKTQIMIIDYEWLGVGRVRMGFVVDGMIYYAHEFLNANSLTTVYMSTPNLPIRSEIANDGNAASQSLTQICSSVISEGGTQENGVIRRVSTNGTHVDMATEDTDYAVIGIKLKDNYLGATVKLVRTSIQLQTASSEIEWKLLFNPVVAGTFTYSDLANSAVKYANGASTNTVTGGYQIAGGYAQSGTAAAGGSDSSETELNNALIIGSNVAGASDSIVLVARPIDGSVNVDVEGSITFRELL